MVERCLERGNAVILAPTDSTGGRGALKSSSSCMLHLRLRRR
ncbi:DUF3678 domain-containing protein [Mesorhizobium sp. B2-7-2]|nr:DUF3678 domain-containing protein [Mesorhizobium sp. B2-7-2]